MAHLCADTSNLMAYHMPMASEASLMAIAQQLVQQQQQQQQQQNHQQQQQQSSSSSRDPSAAAINHWTLPSSAPWPGKPEELPMPSRSSSSSFYSDVLCDFDPASGSCFSEPSSVLDLPSPTLLLDSHVRDSDFDACMGKPYLGLGDAMEMSYDKMGRDGAPDSSSAKERAMGESLRGTEAMTRVEEMGELVVFPSSTFKLPNLQSLGFDSEATCRADFDLADAATEWMDCLMGDLQSDDEAGEETAVSCFDTNPCESTESSEPSNGNPCTPLDAVPGGFAVLEEASFCMRKGSGDGDGGKIASVREEEEDVIPKVEVKAEFEREGYQVPAHGVQLMKLLLECAKRVDNEREKAAKVLPQLRALSSRHGDPIQRLAAYFTAALSKRARAPSPSLPTSVQEECSPEEHTLAYKALNDACPYFKFAQLTANQAILEATEMADKVHIIDFGISQGVQWAALLQAFASRPGGRPPPKIRITEVAASTARDSQLATGKRLAEFAKLLGVELDFQPLAASVVMEEEVEPCSMFRIEEGESVVVNFMLQLCHLLGESQEPLMRVLKVAHALQPKVVTLAEYDASLNSCSFQRRFVNALHFYSAMFDSLEATMRPGCPDRVKMERYFFGDKIESVVGCEGVERKKRLEGREQWREMMEAAGFHSHPLSHYAISQARLLLWLYYCPSFSLTEGQSGSYLSLGWQQRPLLTVSAWSSSSSSPSSSTSN